jgi:hypothetical protein
MAQSGGIRPFYGVIIKDKCKSASPDVLRAYQTVGQDLLNDPNSGYQNDPELKEALDACKSALSK